MAKFQGKNSTYEFTIDKTKKVFHAQASGFFSVEDGTSFLKDYDQLTKTFATGDFNLIIDAVVLKPSSPEVALSSLNNISNNFYSTFLISSANAYFYLSFDLS